VGGGGGGKRNQKKKKERKGGIKERRRTKKKPKPTESLWEDKAGMSNKVGGKRCKLGKKKERVMRIIEDDLPCYLRSK